MDSNHTLLTENKFIKTILIFILIFTGIALKVGAIHLIPKSLTPDETTYLRHASEIQGLGLIAGVQKSIADYNNNLEERLYPIPLRFGVTGPLALSNHFFGQNLNASSSPFLFASASSFIILIIISYFLVGIYGAYCLALISVFFLPEIEITRRIWTESFTELFYLLIVLSGMLIIKSKKAFSFYSLPYIIFGIYVFFIKETAFLILFAGSLIPFGYFLSKKKYLEAVKLFILGLLMILFSLSVLVYMVGSYELLIETYQNHFLAHENNNYAQNYQDGNWYDLLISLFILSPGSIFLLLSAIVMLGFSKKCLPAKLNFNLKFFISYSLLICFLFIFACSVTKYNLNLRQLAPIYPLILLLASTPIALCLKHLANSGNYKTFIIVNILLLTAIGYNAQVAWLYLNTPSCQDFSLRLIMECLNLR